MILDREALERIELHWAVRAVRQEERMRGRDVADARLVRKALRQQLTLQFEDQPSDDPLLERLATAYEVAASEGLDALINLGAKALQAQAQAGAFRAFELRRATKVPATPQEMVFHVLHLSALAYVGDRWADLRRWLVDNVQQVGAPSVADVGWDLRVLYRVYDGWLRLFRKDSWNDLHAIAEIIAFLREEQQQHESKLLGGDSSPQSQAMALRLVGLYHLARATELLASFMLQGAGTEGRIETQLDMHFEKGIKAASACSDLVFEVLLRWLHAAARRMVAGSLWTATATINSRVTKFVRELVKARHPMIELLPPQRAALVEQGLLDPASRAIVIELPTSGGKTTLAQFRILQALNQFAQDGGWVAYVAPTRALVTQILRRLRRDFEPLGVSVEQVTGGIEIDAFEETLLSSASDSSGHHPFDVLVATPEKLGLIIRNKKITRPLALVVVDEAHNIEDEERGLRIELLLATLKKDCPNANYLLLMPFVERPETLAKWLGAETGHAISLGSTAWQPNERIVGFFKHKDEHRKVGRKKVWSLTFETVATTPKTIHLRGDHRVGDEVPLGLDFSSSKKLMNMTAAMAKVFSGRGTSIAIGSTIPTVWKMAETIANDLEPLPVLPDEIALVEKFLKNEVSNDFALAGMLRKGVAVHHAGLPDEARTLVEWLAEEGKLRVLCATTTIAQGINFPVSSVFLSQAEHPTKRGPIPMKPREFWNLAGRAGRVQQDSVGVVGIAVDTQEKEAKVRLLLLEAHRELASRLVDLLDALLRVPEADRLRAVVMGEQWADFRSYVSHLLREAGDLGSVVSNTEQVLRNTYGFNLLRSQDDPALRAKAELLIEVTKGYARQLEDHPERLKLADATGFDPEGVGSAMAGLRSLEQKLTPADWEPVSLFGNGRALSHLVGVMMKLPTLNKQLGDIAGTGKGHTQIAEIAKAWVNGAGIQEIAERYFRDGEPDLTTEVSNACRGIYRALVNSGVWGLAALSKLPGSGIPWDKLDEAVTRRMNMLPAFLYHGVNSEEAVLMRMHQVPRSIATRLGEKMRLDAGHARDLTVPEARAYLRGLKPEAWGRASPTGTTMSGSEYRAIWQQLSGEA